MTDMIKENIVASFRQEVAYAQGTFNKDDFDARRRRWMSLHTVVGLLGHYFGIEGLHDAVGFRKTSFSDPAPFAGVHLDLDEHPCFKVWQVSAQEAAEADVPGPGWYYCESDITGQQTGRDWHGPYPDDEGAYLAATGD